MDKNGCWKKDLKIVEEIFVDYFESIFSTSSLSMELIHKFIESLTRKISEETNIWLVRSFVER